MQLEKLIENILNKHKSVFIPNVGLLSISNSGASLEGTTIVPNKTQVVLNTFETHNDGILTHAIANDTNIDFLEAEITLNKLTKEWIQKLDNNLKISIPNLGDIVNNNGEYKFVESTKSLFPSDFFGLNVLDIKNKKVSEDNIYSNINKSNDSEIIETSKEQVNEPEIVTEPTSPEINNIEIEENKINSEEIIETSSVSHLLNTEFNEPDSNLKEEAWAEIHHDEPINHEIIDSDEEFEESVINTVPEESNMETYQEKEELISKDINENFLGTEDNDITEEDDEENIENDALPFSISNEEEPLEEKIILKEHVPIIYKGETKYDNEYLDFSDYDTDKSSNKWGRVAMILIGFLGLAFLIPYIVASYNGHKFLGMDPLWSNEAKKVDIVKVAPKPIDTNKVLIDTTKISSIDTSLNKTSTTVTEIPKNEPKVTEKMEKITELKNSKTNSKTIDLVKSNSKDLKSTKITTNSAIKTNLKTTKDVILSEVPTAPKLPKSTANIVGKPYATANYTKGNHYVSFGGFKVPANATKLRNDLNKLGVVTDVVLIEGSYKVVIPYTSKAHALNAAQDFPNTTVFE